MIVFAGALLLVLGLISGLFLLLAPFGIGMVLGATGFAVGRAAAEPIKA